MHLRTPRMTPYQATPAPPGPPAPQPFLIARTVELASQTLPAAGAYTAQAFSVIPAGTRTITYWVTYTRGAVGGFPAFRVQWSNGVEAARELVLDKSTLTAVQPNGTFNVYEEQPLGPIPADASAITYVFQFEVPDNTTGCRLLVAEQGVTGTPGTIATAFTGSGGW